jgi:Bacterial Ig-like domain (group 3)/FG-GAP-like repeat/Domain of unknown function (DUF4214)/FG-GAP repeat
MTLANLLRSAVYPAIWIFAPLELVAAGTPTSTVLLTSGSPSVFGSPVQLIANVTPASASGRVTFYDGTTVLGTSTLVAGQAVLNTSMLQTGVRRLRAYYGGSSSAAGSYATSTSAVIQQTVKAAPAAAGFRLGNTSYLGAGSSPQYMAVGDFNGDGNADLAVTDIGTPGGVSVLLGDGLGQFTAAPGSPFAAGSRPQPVVVADFNGDGNPDLAVGNYGIQLVPLTGITVLLGDGSGGFAPASGGPFLTQSNVQSLAVGDFNGDGNADLAVIDAGVSVVVLLGDGAGGFTALSPIRTGIDPFYVSVGDFNGDGRADLAVLDLGYPGSLEFPTLTVLLGDGSGGFSGAPGGPLQLGDYPVSAAVADFNGDGIDDLAIADSNIVIVLGDANGALTASPARLLAGSAYAISVGDFNGDGKLDILTSNVWLGDGKGDFSQGASVSESQHAVADFNGDGRTDVATIGPGSVTVLLGQAQGAIQQVISFGLLGNLSPGGSVLAWATADSGLPVSLTSSTPNVCGVYDNSVFGIADGACSITATQAGNTQYAAAVPVTQTFTVGPVTCSVALNTSNPSGTVPSSGGAGSLYVAASACTWLATSGAPWLAITLPAGAMEMGEGTVNWSAQANTTNAARTAPLYIGDQVYTVSQAAASCTVTLDKTTVSLSDAPTNFLLNVTAAASCNWTATSNAIQLNILQATTDVNGNPILATVPSLPSSGNGILNIQVRRNTSSQPQSGTFDVNGVVLTVNQAGSAFDADTRFIYAMYNNLLAREPDPGGLATYQTVLSNGSYTRDHVAYDMVNSPEFNTDERFAVGLYYGILGRDPEYTGWDFHRRNLHLLRVDQGSLTAAFLATPEYMVRYWSYAYSTTAMLAPPPVDIFITEMYQNAFSRTPSASEISAWEASIATSSRSLAAQTMLASPEFAAGKSLRQTVFLIHAGLLGRVPTTDEFTSFTNAITGGQTVQQAIAQIITGDEFLNEIGP